MDVKAISGEVRARLKFLLWDSCVYYHDRFCFSCFSSLYLWISWVWDGGVFAESVRGKQSHLMPLTKDRLEVTCLPPPHPCIGGFPWAQKNCKYLSEIDRWMQAQHHTTPNPFSVCFWALHPFLGQEWATQTVPGCSQPQTDLCHTRCAALTCLPGAFCFMMSSWKEIWKKERRWLLHFDVD